VAAVDSLNCVVFKRKRFPLDVEHEVNAGSTLDVNPEEALSLVLSTAKLD